MRMHVHPCSHIACMHVHPCSHIACMHVHPCSHTHACSHTHMLTHMNTRAHMRRSSELLGKEMASAAGITIVNGCPNGQELMQYVHMFSYGCTEFEALSAVGLDETEVTFTLAGPAVANNEGVRYTIYGMDFSSRLHGNPSLAAEEPLPNKAWAMGVTAYGTTHGATWAHRVAAMAPPQAREFLSSCMGFPGSTVLGSESAHGRRIRMGEEYLESHEGAQPPRVPDIGDWVKVLSIEGEWMYGTYLVEVGRECRGWVDWDGGKGTLWWSDLEAAGLLWDVVRQSGHMSVRGHRRGCERP